MTFEHGELYERSFETAFGSIDVVAEIVISAGRLELRDLAVYSTSPQRVSVPLPELVWWVRLALAEARSAGFVELRVTATRLTGASPGRTIDTVIPLTARKQP